MLKYLKPKFRYIILGLLSILILSAVGYYGCQEYTLYNIKSNLGATNAVAAHNNGYGTCNTDPNATLPQLGVSGEICGADNSILVLSKASILDGVGARAHGHGHELLRGRGPDPTLLWLWCRPAATAPIRPLAWEPPYALGVALKKKGISPTKS